MGLCFLRGVVAREEVSVKKEEAVRLRELRRGVDIVDVEGGKDAGEGKRRRAGTERSTAAVVEKAMRR